jgi:hypothetical protein
MRRTNAYPPSTRFNSDSDPAGKVVGLNPWNGEGMTAAMIEASGTTPKIPVIATLSLSPLPAAPRARALGDPKNCPEVAMMNLIHPFIVLVLAKTKTKSGKRKIN